MTFKMSLVPYGIGTLLLVLGVIAVFEAGGAESWLLLATGVLLYILGVLIDIRGELTRS